MMLNELVIYTDGACKKNPGPGGWGVYISSISDGEVKFCGGSKMTTNNIMELTATVFALEMVLERYPGYKVILYSDSTYVLKGISEWMGGWIRRGWKTAGGKDVKNKELWVQLNKLANQVDVDWRKVKGHSGNPGNDMADKLANMGVPK